MRVTDNLSVINSCNCFTWLDRMKSRESSQGATVSSRILFLSRPSLTTICNRLKLNSKCCLLDRLPLNYKKWSRWVETTASLTYTLKNAQRNRQFTVELQQQHVRGWGWADSLRWYVCSPCSHVWSMLTLKFKLHRKTFNIVTFCEAERISIRSIVWRAFQLAIQPPQREFYFNRAQWITEAISIDKFKARGVKKPIRTASNRNSPPVTSKFHAKAEEDQVKPTNKCSCKFCRWERSRSLLAWLIDWLS